MIVNSFQMIDLRQTSINRRDIGKKRKILHRVQLVRYPYWPVIIGGPLFRELYYFDRAKELKL